MGPVGYSAGTIVAHRSARMEPHSPAEELPALYRAILDRVAMLEAADERAEAARVRTKATAAYRARGTTRRGVQLEGLLRRAERPTTAERVLGRRGQPVRLARIAPRNRTASAAER